MLSTVAYYLYQGVRVVAAGAFVLAALIALTHWAVRGGTLQPFGFWPRFVRRWGDPLLRPVEHRIARAGGNPQDAPTWLLVGAVVAGLLLVGITDWVLGFLATTIYAIISPQGSAAAALVATLFDLLKAAIMIRVISSWFAISPYSRWMRPVVILTDWLLEPIRRFLPTFGPLDLSPLVAYFILVFAKELVLRAFFGA